MIIATRRPDGTHYSSLEPGEYVRIPQVSPPVWIAKDPDGMLAPLYHPVVDAAGELVTADPIRRVFAAGPVYQFNAGRWSEV